MRTGILISILLYAFQAAAQISSMPFNKVELRVDTLIFDTNKNLVTVNKEQKLYFKYSSEEQDCQVRLYSADFSRMRNLKLMPSADFELLDSLAGFEREYIQFTVRFLNLSSSDFLNFIFTYLPIGKDTVSTVKIPLLPYTNTRVALYTNDDQLFIGEEKTYELTSNHTQNVRLSSFWTTDQPINYRLTFENSHLYLHLLSTTLGSNDAVLSLKTIKPYIDSVGNLKYDLPVIRHAFTVKESRLRFLNTDLDEIIQDPNNRDGYLIQLDNAPFFSLQKTYRVEDQESPGGPLIAEIFTKNYLSNGRILCRILPYFTHRKTDGYLYIKDNEVARFVMNVNIVPKTLISKLSLLREGGDWTSDLSVYPGESVDLKIEGQSLQLGQFTYEGLNVSSSDSLVSNDNVAIYHLRIPYKIPLKQITIYHDRQNTGYSLSVKEYQRPRPFDYINFSINGAKTLLSDEQGVVLYNNVIDNVSFTFDRNKIDSEGQLYGKQYLQIKVTITGKNNELLEVQTIDDIIICPGPYSPRSSFYDNKDCTQGDIELNRYLNKKTYDLDGWSKISIEVKNKKENYNGAGFTKNVDIILVKTWRFDIDVSFPAGLLTFNKANSGSLTGISMAMVAQFSFYDKNRINTFKPYKIGVGFIALDAFNFSKDASDRDIAMVLLASLYPTRKDLKLTFPLYLGAGYKMKSGQFFFLVGPGIAVNF